MDYKKAGVNIQQGDEASRAAYAAAKSTFDSRKGLIGAPYTLDGGYAGALDMGNFLLIQNDDGTGTKSEIAARVGDFSTLGYDLLAMVADDAICVGAEVISVTNTIDTPKVNKKIIQEMANGLAQACREQKIVIPGGEIAELGGALNDLTWNATAVGVVKKHRYLTGKNIVAGDAVIALAGRVLRSNGTTLARKILENTFGADWHTKKFTETINWGQVLLTPSRIFHRTLLDTLIGDFATENPLNKSIKGISHITGGGISGNLPRILPEGLGANLPLLHEPHEALKQLQKIGNVAEKEAYRAWHSGSAMLLVVDPAHAQAICTTLNQHDENLQAQIAGTIIAEPKIIIHGKYSNSELVFDRE